MEKRLGALFSSRIVGAMYGKWNLTSSWKRDIPSREVCENQDATFEELVAAIEAIPEGYYADAHLILASQGGHVSEVKRWEKFIDAIRSTGGSVSTYNPERAISSAAWIFMLGDPGKRFMTPEAILGLHGVSPEVFTETIQQKLVEENAELRQTAEAFLSGFSSEDRNRLLDNALNRVGQDCLYFRAQILASVGATSAV